MQCDYCYARQAVKKVAYFPLDTVLWRVYDLTEELPDDEGHPICQKCLDSIEEDA